MVLEVVEFQDELEELNERSERRLKELGYEFASSPHHPTRVYETRHSTTLAEFRANLGTIVIDYSTIPDINLRLAMKLQEECMENKIPFQIVGGETRKALLDEQLSDLAEISRKMEYLGIR